MRQSAADQGATLSPSDRGEIDLVALFREVGRRKWLVLICTALALVGSVLAVNMLKPRYTAETSVFLENRESEYTRIGREGGRAQDPLIDQDAVLSQVQLVMSRDIARLMMQKFDLGSKREFDTLMDGVDPVTKTLIMFGVLDNPANVSPEERVMEKYFDKLKVFGKAKSRVLAIEFQSRDPELAAKMSQAIAEEYIRQLEQAKKGTAQSAGTWLARTIEQLRQRVSVAESKVEAYRNANGLFLVGTENNNISSQQLSELNTQLATARAQQADLSSRARLIREAVRQGRIFEVSEVVNNEVVRRLIEARATLRAQIAQEERTLLPQHPRIKELYAQLTGLEEQIRAAADRAARALDNDARAAGARVAASQGELDQQKKLNGSANENEVQLRALEREAKAEREQLENYLARYRDASVRDVDNAVAADARIVSRPNVPSSPTFPKKLPTILIATLAGFVLSLFWVLTRALLSDRVYSRRAPEMAASYPAMPMMTPQMMAQMYAMMNPAMMPQAGMMQPAHAGAAASVHPAQYHDHAQQQAAPVVAEAEPVLKQPVLKEAAPATASAGSVAQTAAAAVSAKASASADAMRAALGRLGNTLNSHKAAAEAQPLALPEGRVTASLLAAGNNAPQSAPKQHPQSFSETVASALQEPVKKQEMAHAHLPVAPAVQPEADNFLVEPSHTSVVRKPLEAFDDAAPVAPVQVPQMVAPAFVAGAPADYHSLDEDDSYDPLVEVADEAQAALIRGRPVSILVVGVEGGAFAQPTMRKLEQILSSRGPVAQLSIDPMQVQSHELSAAIKGLGGNYDYALALGGAVSGATAMLSRAVTLTVLVASADLEDPRTDKATAMLPGCNYFIVSAVSASAGAKV
ncbi:MAG: GumC family protein [Beijerinckiaceae bacterium]